MTKARFVQTRQSIFYGKYIYNSVPAMVIPNKNDISHSINDGVTSLINKKFLQQLKLGRR